MRNSEYSKITINGEDYSRYFRLPFVIQKSLDEQLDYAVIELFNTPIKDPFKPFSMVSVGSLNFILSDDSVEAHIGTGLYKHSITLIEQTKEAERIICGSKAFTNPIVRDYTEAQTYVYAVKGERKSTTSNIYSVDSYNRQNPVMGSKHKSPVLAGQILIFPDFGVEELEQGRETYTVKVYSAVSGKVAQWKNGFSEFEIVGQEVYSKDVKYGSSGVIGAFVATEPGLYGLAFIGSYFALYTEIYVASEPVSKPPYTVEKVITTLLETAEPIRDGLETPRYTLTYSENQAKKMQQNAPEFHFSNGRSLWENLREVGRFIHAIPRIDGDRLTFDDLGDTEYADMSKGRMIGKTSSFSISDYTAGLESFVNNLVNLDDESDGSISEPWDNGFVSMRAASEDARIEENTGLVKLHLPIEKVLKFELGQFEHGGKTYPAADLTAYLFEKSEYDLLTNYSGQYPTSKTYAVYYTRGGSEITGFWHKAQDSGSSIFDAFENYSLTNIIEIATGVNSGFFDQLDYTDLTFRVSYIPSVTARIRQYKPSYDGSFPSVVAHNQSANKMSARAFGENLRGQLAMMGTTSDTVMYMFPRFSDVPRAGTLYDQDNYISSISCRVYPDFVITQMNLSTGYNELGAYVETNNAIRQFEIPESEDRYIVIDEFCVIGETQESDDSHTAATVSLKEQIRNAFEPTPAAKDVSLAIVRTYDENKNLITTTPIALPVVSLAIGTSIYFGFRFEDNFSAGSQSIDGGSMYRYQEYVPYGDPFYSEARTMDFRLVSGAYAVSDELASAHALPEMYDISTGTEMVNVSSTYPLIVDKDSADALCITYQLHFMTSSGYIIGDGTAYHCPAIRKETNSEQAHIYFYDHRINQLTGTTDTESYVAKYPVYADTTSPRIYHDGVPNQKFQSWAIIKDGRFMIGKNTDKLTRELYFSFKRRLGQ